MLDMSSALHEIVHELHAVDRMINKTIRTLLEDREMTPDAFRFQARLAKSTYYNRMALRGEWTAAEVKRAADVLGVDVATLYYGLQLPQKDSNFQPTGLRATRPYLRLAS